MNCNRARFKVLKFVAFPAIKKLMLNVGHRVGFDRN